MLTKKQANILADKKTSVSISYPPLFKKNTRPFLSQNRQFQWTNTKNVIYPVILASAATLLQKNNFQVYWDDAITENLDYKTWLKRLQKRKPDYIVIETKTPVVKLHWKIIKEIKKILPKSKIIMLGDHVTALPDESYKNCPVDKILIGGHFDFLLLNYLTKTNIPIDLNKLPPIDRTLTNWQNYSINNTNYKYKPGAYTMFGRDCWWGKCTFCSWTTLFPGNCYKAVSPKKAFLEVKNLIKLGVKEIFDDSGTFPVGPWLKEFCNHIIKNNLPTGGKISLGCNMRFGALSENEFSLMQKAGFRFMLFGLESANQKTLNKINKNNTTENIIPTLKLAKKYNIESHITVMIGYPWESKKDIQKTLNLAKYIFKNNLAASIQATIIIPYPGTPLFTECKKKKLLLSTDWNQYDMSRPIIKTKISKKETKQLVKDFYKSIISPKYIFQKIISIKNLSDIKHLFFYTIKYFKKLNDFS